MCPYHCERCGRANPRDSKVCKHCGSPIDFSDIIARVEANKSGKKSNLLQPKKVTSSRQEKALADLDF